MKTAGLILICLGIAVLLGTVFVGLFHILAEAIRQRDRVLAFVILAVLFMMVGMMFVLRAGG